jgi:hypothetical protein
MFVRETDFFITSTLTFCMSTFWLNSGGNLVDFSSFWSTEVAMSPRSALIAQLGGGLRFPVLEWTLLHKT